MGTMQHPAVRKRYRGTLTLWNEPRYFGFITLKTELPEIGKTIFVHRLNFMAGIPTASISVGREVEFEISAPYKIGRKPQAVRVKLLETPTAGLAVLKQGGAL